MPEPRERVEKAKTSYYELYEEDRMLCEERDGLASRLKEILEERRTLSETPIAPVLCRGYRSGDKRYSPNFR